MRILITGAAGYLGAQLGTALATSHTVVGTDIRMREGLPFPLHRLDVRDPALEALLRSERIEAVVHLAAVLEGSGDRARDYDIDVNGTRAVIGACVAAGVRHLTVTSSGAAYGYHADNPAWLTETDPLRGNPEFPYADHKRQVEALLAAARVAHPELGQLIFRIGTVLGTGTNNAITRLFHRPYLLGIRGSESPFVFVWDADVIGAIRHGVTAGQTGMYNLAGDGALTMRELAALLGKPLVSLPAPLVRGILRVARALRLTTLGPEQVRFLQYRPVLSNAAFRRDSGYTLRWSSREAFLAFMAAQGLGNGSATSD